MKAEDARGGSVMGPDPGEGGLAELRTLLLGEEYQRLVELRERLEDPALFAESVAKVLSEAAVIRSGHGDSLVRAFQSNVENSLRASVERNPQPLVNAIFPIIGPAIRRTIIDTLNRLLQTLNETLEYSLSPKAFRWRFEAWRSGKSYAEIVLLHTLVYQVEQVFLIHKNTGLLLQHVVSERALVTDPQMVSGMLTAFQEFITESFRLEGGESLQSMRMGELNLLVRDGPQAVLAAVVRGTSPTDLDLVLTEVLEEIHLMHARDLTEFDGDDRPFAASAPHLEKCLKAQVREKRRRKPWFALGFLALLACLLGLWGYSAYQKRSLWRQALSRLQEEPGIVVVDAEKRWGRYVVRGLRDALAREPRLVVGPEVLEKIPMEGQWDRHVSTEPQLVLARARRVLEPPGTVSMEVVDGELRISGTAPTEWIESLQSRALLVPGVEQLSQRGLRPSDGERVAFEPIKHRLESTILYFDRGTSSLTKASAERLDALAATIRDLQEFGAAAKRRLAIQLTGHSDPTGTEAMNLALSQERAERVLAELLRRGLDAGLFAVQGVASRSPLRTGSESEDQWFNRRVTFAVRFLADDQPKGAGQ